MTRHRTLTEAMSRYMHNTFTVETARLHLQECLDRVGNPARATVICLSGTRPSTPRPYEGVGEMVSLCSNPSTDVSRALESLDLVGEWTLGEFLDWDGRRSSPVGGLKWAVQMAGLDLALWNMHLGFSHFCHRPVAALRFLVSVPPQPNPVDEIRKYIVNDPTLEFRLKVSSDWADDVWGALAAIPEVKMLQLDGFDEIYQDDPVVSDRLRRLLTARPDILVENPGAVATEVQPEAPDRVCWNEDFGTIEEIQSRAQPGDYVCLKPCLFDSVRGFVEAIDFCKSERILMYGGDQREVGPARTQHHAIAASLYPMGPNDLAPYEYYLRPRPMAEANPIEPTYHTKQGLRFRNSHDKDPWFKGLHPEVKIRGRREELGLTQDELAARVGIALSSYRDVEEMEEDFYYLPPRLAKALARVLDLDLLGLTGLSGLQDTGTHLPKEWLAEPLHEIIRRRRVELGLTVPTVAGAYGEQLVERVEAIPGYLEEKSSVAFAVDLSRVLRLPADYVLGLHRPRFDSEV